MASAPTRSPINIAVVGIGQIGPRHVQSILGCRDATLLCVVDPGPSAVDVATSLGTKLFPSVAAMLEECRPDGAYVCTPNSVHAANAAELLKAGIHVLVEKPIATIVADGKRVVELARSSERHLLVGHHRRFNPFVVAAKDALSKGVVGTVIAVSGLWMTGKPDSYYLPPTEWRRRSGIGGPILINLIHEVDILMYLLGPITRVYAEMTLSSRGYEAEEGAAVLLRFTSGVVGTFLLSDATPSNHNFESATGENPIVPRAGKDIYRIFGSEGTLSVGDQVLTRHADGTARNWTEPIHDESIGVIRTIPFDAQVAHFVEVVRGTEEPRCSGEDGLRALVVCDAIKRAIASGNAVDI
ncbi:hypothetical protein BAUCODRAFT_86880, partial [Baudoinia panamericana UAMH 10762]